VIPHPPDVSRRATKITSVPDWKQVLRSGTSVGALVKEAEHAQSRADFVNKMNVALKEANETEYWLMLLKDSEYIDEKSFRSIHQDSSELIKLLASIVKTTKEKP
jgi:four helix bundle protein